MKNELSRPYVHLVCKKCGKRRTIRLSHEGMRKLFDRKRRDNFVCLICRG